MRSYKSESTVSPQEWDKTTSPDVVYHNTNIVEAPATEDRPAMFEYDVDEYSQLEYLRLANEQMQEVIDTMLGGVTGET